MLVIDTKGLCLGCIQFTQSFAIWSLSGRPACLSLATSATALRAALPPALWSNFCCLCSAAAAALARASGSDTGAAEAWVLCISSYLLSFPPPQQLAQAPMPPRGLLLPRQSPCTCRWPLTQWGSLHVYNRRLEGPGQNRWI